LKKTKLKNPMAVVDVGSSFIRLLIGQDNGNGGIDILDDLSKPTGIGRDTFTSQKINAQAMQQACEILKGYSKVMREYHITNYRAVATSGLREAINKEYAIERFKQSAGINVEIINNAQERFFIYKALTQNLKNFDRLQAEGALVITIGSGGLGISLYFEKRLAFREYFKLGSLRLWESIADMERSAVDVPKIMDEFLESKIYSIRSAIESIRPKHFIALGGEISTICSITGECEHLETGRILKKSTLLNLAEKIKKTQADEMIELYSITRNEFEILFPSVIILSKILHLTDSSAILIPEATLRHGMIVDLADDLLSRPGREIFLRDILKSVWHLAKKFDTDIEHCEKVREISLKIFDSTQKTHKMGPRERFFVEVASILHDVGRYVNVNQHEEQSYHIIKATEILGFSDTDIDIVANMARYHSNRTPVARDNGYQRLGVEEKIVVSKGAAILKLAEAMDTTHKDYIERFHVDYRHGKYNFIIESIADTALEEWNFNNAAIFFEDVLGVPAIFIQKGW
jgi:exopolyphosphatase/guanosine-5'-triphosphate,3'-diphosphate pyrophosphatase